MKTKLLTVFTLLYVVFFTYQCERKLTGLGDDGEIRVLADSTIWIETESLLENIFEIPIMTPQDETIFTILKGDLNNFKKFKNLIFITTIEDEGIVAELVKNNLSEEAKQRIEEGSYVFIKKDQWATNQMIMFLVSTDLRTLKDKLTVNRDYLFRIFDEYWDEAQKSLIYKFDEQIDISKYLLRTHGWTLRVPLDYSIFIEKPDSNFLMLRRMLPERWIFVHWIDTDDPSILTEQWCLETRDELTIKYYEGDKIEVKFVQPEIKEVDFLGRNAIKMSGLWRSDEKSAGGPFRNYCFYDEEQQRIYMVDFALFSPRLKKSKRHFLRQAEIILKTFETAENASQESP